LCATFFVGFGAGSRLTARLGAWMVIIGGLLVAAAGLALLSGISANGSYLVDLLPGMLVAPVGAGATFVAVTITAMTGEGDAGLASGMLTTAQQVGSALGLAVLVSLAVARTHELHSTGATPPVAAAGGFSLSFGAASGVLAAGVLLTFFAMRSRITSRCDDDRPVVETR